MKKHDREVRAMVKEAECEILEWQVNRHIKLRLKTVFGAEFTFIMPRTPSCHRWSENQRTYLARKIAELRALSENPPNGS